MDVLSGSLIMVAIAIAGHGVAWFFKTPKESQGEITRRVDDLEDMHHTLDKNFIRFSERMIGEIQNLSEAINRLAQIIGQKGMTVSGEHRTLRK